MCIHEVRRVTYIRVLIDIRMFIAPASECDNGSQIALNTELSIYPGSKSVYYDLWLKSSDVDQLVMQ